MDTLVIRIELRVDGLRGTLLARLTVGTRLTVRTGLAVLAWLTLLTRLLIVTRLTVFAGLAIVTGWPTFAWRAALPGLTITTILARWPLPAVALIPWWAGRGVTATRQFARLWPAVDHRLVTVAGVPCDKLSGRIRCQIRLGTGGSPGGRPFARSPHTLATTAAAIAAAIPV
jgi:hypothetical protein